MIREALKILAALLENCASAINERLDPPLPEYPVISSEALAELYMLRSRPQPELRAVTLIFPANDETITRH